MWIAVWIIGVAFVGFLFWCSEKILVATSGELKGRTGKRWIFKKLPPLKSPFNKYFYVSGNHKDGVIKKGDIIKIRVTMEPPKDDVYVVISYSNSDFTGYAIRKIKSTDGNYSITTHGERVLWMYNIFGVIEEINGKEIYSGKPIYYRVSELGIRPLP